MCHNKIGTGPYRIPRCCSIGRVVVEMETTSKHSKVVNQLVKSKVQTFSPEHSADCSAVSAV
ncbi:hypothetical protein COOONC_11033 [Cooperia oncophora]